MIKKMLSYIVIVLLTFGMVTALLGEIAVAGADAGRNAASFLKIGHGARSAALGGAFTAISEGAVATYWNPAGLTSLESSEIVLGHFVWLQDITVEQVAFAMPAFSNMVTAVSVTYVNYGTIEGFDNAGITTGELSAYDLAAGLSLGYKLTDDLSFGVTGKYIAQRLETYQATAFAADLGIKYSLERLSLAMALTNVGTSLKFDAVKESLPQSLRLGMAYRPFGRGIVTSLEWEHEQAGGTFVRQGVELGFSERYYVRTGYEYVIGADNLSFASGLTTGLGMRFGSASIDYAFTPDYRSVSEDVHRFTLLFDFGSIAPHK